MIDLIWFVVVLLGFVAVFFDLIIVAVCLFIFFSHREELEHIDTEDLEEDKERDLDK